MDMGDSIVAYTYDYRHSASKHIYEYCCKKPVKGKKKRESPLLNFKVSGDGTWKSRGYKSLYGIAALIAYYTRKVIDMMVQSCLCQPYTY